MSGFILPPRSQVGYADPEVLNEGVKVTLSDGEKVSWTPPPAKLAMPDWSGIKSIAHYFNRKGGPVYPAWVFHPTEPDRIVKNAEEARALGIFYREASQDEKERYGLQAVWDWEPGCLWRPKKQRFDRLDSQNIDTGKVLVTSNAPQQNFSVENVVSTVTASVLAALKVASPTAPASVDPQRWEAFLAFEAFQKTQETVNALASDEDDRDSWLAEADRIGVKVDKRWSTERIKSEVQKAA